MECCISIQIAGLSIALSDMIINLVGIFLSLAVLLYQACFSIKCRIPVTEAIAKEIHRKYSTSQASQTDELSDEELVEIIDSEFWPLLLFIILCINQVIFNSMLIHGIRKNDLQKVKVWLVFKACIVLVGIFLILTQDSIGQGVYRQISEILYVFLTLFFMCIIFILYDVMHRSRRHHRNHNNGAGPSGASSRSNHRLILN